MCDVTLTDIQRLQANSAPRDAALAMDEDAFRAFYERTSRPLWVYLARMSGSQSDADDLLQETYYRLFRTGAAFADEDHRRRYLYTVATNLVIDRHRRTSARPEAAIAGDAETVAGSLGAGSALERQTVVRRVLSRLRPRDRALLWLAYAQGASHDEIGSTLGLKSASVRSMLFRARRRFTDLFEGKRSRGGVRAAE